MKKILFCITILIMVIFISLKVNYNSHIIFTLGNTIDGDYRYFYNDTRIEDIIDDIDNNVIINNRHIQNILVKADYIYLDLNELNLNKNSVINIELLLDKIKNYSKEQIVIILRKGSTSLDKSLNSWIFNLVDKYDIIVKR